MLTLPRFRSKVLGLALACFAAPVALAAQAAGPLVLDSASIAESGARTLADLLAARVPGLGVTYLTGAPGIAAHVSARGSVGFSGSGRPALIVDGVLMRDDLLWIGETPDGHALADHWNLPVEEILRVEVVLGASSGMALELGASRGAVIVQTQRPQGGAWRARAFADVRSVGAGTAIRPASTRRGDLSGGGSTYYCTLQAEAAGTCTPTGQWTHEPFPDGSPFAGTQRARGGLSATGALPFGLRGRVAAVAESDPGALGSPIARTDVAAALTMPRRGRWQSNLDLRVQHVAGDFLAYSAFRRAATYGPYDADSSLDPQSTFADVQLQAPAWKSSRVSLGSRSEVELTAQTSVVLQAGVEALNRSSIRDFRSETGFGGPGRTRSALESTRDAWSISLEARDRRALGRVQLTSSVALLRSDVGQSDSLWSSRAPDVGDSLWSVQRQALQYEGHTQRLSLRVDDRSGVSIGAGLRREGTLSDPAVAFLPHADVRWGWTPSRPMVVTGLDLWTAYGESIDLQSFGDALARNVAAFPGVGPGDIERTREWELGSDVRLFGDAVTLSARGFRRNVDDAVIYQPSFVFGEPYRLVMGAAIETRGGEIALHMQRALGVRGRVAARLWIAGARSEYGGDFLPSLLQAPDGIYLPSVLMEIAPGRAVGDIAVLGRDFADTNGNGIIESAELGSPRIVDRGSLLPRRTVGATLQATLGRATFGTTFEGKSGHVRPRSDGNLCSWRRCDGLYDAGASLDTQAEALARFTTLVDASFLRMRELWVRWRVADGRFGDVSVSLVGQNLLTWAASGGEDPETGARHAGGIAAGFYQQPIAPSLGLRIDIGAGVAR